MDAQLLGRTTEIGFFQEWAECKHKNDIYLIEAPAATVVSRKSGADKRYPVLLKGGKFLYDMVPAPMADNLVKSQPYMIDESGNIEVDNVCMSVSGCTLFLMGSPQSSSNYFHWFAFYFSSLIFLDQIKRRKNCLVLVPRLLPYQRESLAAAGLTLAKVIEYEGQSIRGDSLLIPSTAMAIQRVRREVLPLYRKVSVNVGASVREQYPRRLYLLRGKTAQRKIVNEDEIVSRLKYKGFVAVDPGAMSLGEQARLFRDATHIVSPHGAALTNLIFCENVVSVLECFSETWVHGCYRDLCAMLGCDYYYTIGRSVEVGSEARERPYVIDWEAIAEYLDTI